MPDKLEEVRDIYSGNFAEELEESDEIDEAEEGFMKGYNEENLVAECANCKKILNDKVVEEEASNKVYRFCSERCANKFLKEY